MNETPKQRAYFKRPTQSRVLGGFANKAWEKWDAFRDEKRNIKYVSGTRIAAHGLMGGSAFQFDAAFRGLGSGFAVTALMLGMGIGWIEKSLLPRCQSLRKRLSASGEDSLAKPVQKMETSIQYFLDNPLKVQGTIGLASAASFALSGFSEGRWEELAFSVLFGTANGMLMWRKRGAQNAGLASATFALGDGILMVGGFLAGDYLKGSAGLGHLIADGMLASARNSIPSQNAEISETRHHSPKELTK